MFSNNAYMKIWEVRENEGRVSAIMSSSKKKVDKAGNPVLDANGKQVYEQDWSGWASFVGKAKDVGKTLTDQSRIQIISCGVTNSYNKETKETGTYYTIFECKDVTGQTGDGTTSAPATSQTSAGDGFSNIPDSEEEELPF